MYYSEPPKDPRDGISDAIGLLIGIAIAFWIAALLSSCSPKTIAVPEYHTEYVTKTDTLLRLDSIIRHDSVSVYLQGDTICKDRYKYIYKYRNIYKTRTDTLIKTDSITTPVYIEKQLTKWQRLQMNFGWWAAIAILVLVVGLIIKKRG